MVKDEIFLKYLEEYDIEPEDYPDVEWEDFKAIYTDTLRYNIYALNLTLKELYFELAEIIARPILDFIINLKE